MKRSVIYLLLISVLLFAGCAEEREHAPLTPAVQDGITDGPDAQALAWALVREAGWPVEAAEDLPQPDPECHGTPVPHVTFERTPLVGDIVHYYAEIPIGPGFYDKVGLHRVVRESHPNRPIHTRKALFYQHGDAKNFVGCVLPGLLDPSTPLDFGFAVYLAQHDVDVWGIDQPWCFVPIEETNFEFMTDWGLQWALDNLSLGMSVARFSRAATGNGNRKMNLCGYSAGVWTGYALLNQETQIPRGQRNVGGFIPVDGVYKTDYEYLREFFCESVPTWPTTPQFYVGFNDLGRMALDDLRVMPFTRI